MNWKSELRKFVSFLIGVVFITGIALAILLSSGCAHLDPLGTPAAGKKGEADFVTRGGVICRELSGKLGIDPAEAYGQGFRCLDVGETSVEGCIKYTDGRFHYTSPGCTDGQRQ